MKINKTRLAEFVRHKLATDAQWALRALLLVYGLQTADEQNTGTTKEDNGVGFSGVDAEFLTSLAKQYTKHGRLSQNQTVWLHKKIKKYSRQVMLSASPFELCARFAKAQH
jgi:hypothetical protein